MAQSTSRARHGRIAAVSTREPSDFARALNALCDKRWPRSQRWTNPEIAAGVSDILGRTITRQYIYRLRTGATRTVSSDVRDALCVYFDVPLTYFSAVDADATLTEQLTAHGLAVAGLRSTQLSEKGARDLERIFAEASAILERERQ